MCNIKKIKCYDEGDAIRLTFDWPQGISQVFISTEPDPAVGRLFTLQEYKKQAGYTTLKIQGAITFYIYPSQREDGEDIIYDPTEFAYTNPTIITFSLAEEIEQYKNYRLTISANYPVPEEIICYVKKENAIPNDISDGVLYPFSEALTPNQPMTRIIRTTKNEYINLFIQDVNNAKLYQLIQIKEGS